MELSLFLAFVAGVLSFLSPCVLPLVPPYMAYIAGTTLDNLTDEERPPTISRQVLGAAFLFVLGFSTVFVTLGATASALGRLVMGARIGLFGLTEPVPLVTLFGWLAGIAIIAMGLHFLGVFRLSALYREARFSARAGGPLGAYIMGLAFAFGWTPCIGPVLAAILALAAASETVTRGVVLLSVYSAGLAMPFIGAALALKPFMAAAKRFRHRFGLVEKAMGAFLVLTGILFLSGTITNVSFWLLENAPSLYEFERRLMEGARPPA